MQSWSEQNHSWNARFFIPSSILLLNTFKKTEISHAQRHNSRRRKAVQSFLFWSGSYTFHVALIIQRGKVWGRAIQLNHTSLPCFEERNSELFCLNYWAVLRQKISYTWYFFTFSSALMRHFSFSLWEFSSLLKLTILRLVSVTPISAQQRMSCFLFGCSFLVSAAAAVLSTFHSNTELPKHTSRGCADESRREPEAGATARWAELQCFFTRLAVGAGASSPSLCAFLKLGIM